MAATVWRRLIAVSTCVDFVRAHGDWFRILWKLSGFLHCYSLWQSGVNRPGFSGGFIS